MKYFLNAVITMPKLAPNEYIKKTDLPEDKEIMKEE